ncbi:hypothetical protein [Nitrosophilus kaiyonis]|uniref:hypothetical protein n=1 Tax=Nitrosophilus kaiyonis TaxID=2930200 RepID=UPI00249243A5|nr:hypothetical protein [Nitrosophilus kaiyonis]
MFRVLLLIFLLLFVGCEQKDTKLENKSNYLQEKKAKLDEKIAQARAKADKEKELALLKMRKRLEELSLKSGQTEAQKEIEIAKIKAQKELEIQKIQKELKLKELELQKERQKIELENQKLLAQKEIEVKKEFLVFSLIGLILIILAILTVLYFYKKRKDKIIAYHDNLEKYFRMKENEAKVAIANKIIDTIAEGKLSPEQEQRLLGVLKGDLKELPKDIEKKDEVVDALIEEGKENDSKHRE